MTCTAGRFTAARAKRLKSWRPAQLLKTGRRWTGILTGCLALLPVLAPLAAQAAGFPPRISLENSMLEQVGRGTLRYAGIIPVCDIALYRDPAAQAVQLLDPRVAKRLDIVYRAPLRADRLVRTAEAILARQHTAQRLARWRAQLDTLHRSYSDVQAGDRYTLTYLPQQGVWVELNGERVHTVTEDAFAEIYFGIWLGEKPLSESLRLQLMPAAAPDARPAETALTSP